MLRCSELAGTCVCFQDSIFWPFIPRLLKIFRAVNNIYFLFTHYSHGISAQIPLRTKWCVYIIPTYKKNAHQRHLGAHTYNVSYMVNCAHIDEMRTEMRAARILCERFSSHTFTTRIHRSGPTKNQHGNYEVEFEKKYPPPNTQIRHTYARNIIFVTPRHTLVTLYKRFQVGRMCGRMCSATRIHNGSTKMRAMDPWRIYEKQTLQLYIQIARMGKIWCRHKKNLNARILMVTVTIWWRSAISRKEKHVFSQF